jgi:hypothetical protein
MKLIAKDIGIAWYAFCYAMALLCGALTLSYWNVLDLPPFGKFLIALLMTNGFAFMSLALVTLIKARGREVGNIWRFGLGAQPEETELTSLWQFSRATMISLGIHVLLISCFAVYLRSHSQK